MSINQLQPNIYVKPELEIEFTPQGLVDWIQWLYLKERSKLTIETYKYTIKQYLNNIGNILSKSKVIEYKKYLVDNFKPKTVNVRIQGINCLIEYFAELYENPKILNFKAKSTKLHTRTSVENVITTKEFRKLLGVCLTDKSIRDGEKWYLIFKTLGYTGIRRSELIKLQAEDIFKYGYFKIIGKGAKFRDVLIPDELKEELINYVKARNITGNLFTADSTICKNSTSISDRAIDNQMKQVGKKAGIPVEHCHPHSLRHMYALNLLEATNKDISFVSDMLGHASLNTTSVYLKMSLDQQKKIINRKVKW